MSLLSTVQLTEGQIFWRCDSPPSSSHSNSIRESGLRPVLLFIHAAVADHTLWDEQVAYCTMKGWQCLRFDLFGYGQSWVGKDYLAKEFRPPVRHHDHAALVVEALHSSAEFRQRALGNQKVIVVALSHGAVIAVDLALSHPELVSGLVLCAGGLGGFDIPDAPDEEAMFAQFEDYMGKKDAESAAMMNVRIWGDGTRANEGRLNEDARGKLFKWCKDIAQSELNGEGGHAIPCEELDNPPAVERLPEIEVKAMLAIGKYDESSTNAAMRYAADHLKDATLTEFDAAHMINLECPADFNEWLGAFLDSDLHREGP